MAAAAVAAASGGETVLCNRCGALVLDSEKAVHAATHPAPDWGDVEQTKCPLFDRGLCTAADGAVALPDYVAHMLQHAEDAKAQSMWEADGTVLSTQQMLNLQVARDWGERATDGLDEGEADADKVEIAGDVFALVCFAMRAMRDLRKHVNWYVKPHGDYLFTRSCGRFCYGVFGNFTFKYDDCNVPVVRNIKGEVMRLSFKNPHIDTPHQCVTVTPSSHPPKKLGLSQGAAELFDKTVFGGEFGKYNLMIFMIRRLISQRCITAIFDAADENEDKKRSWTNTVHILQHNTHKFFVESGCTVNEALTFLGAFKCEMVVRAHDSKGAHHQRKLFRDIFLEVFEPMHNLLERRRDYHLIDGGRAASGKRTAEIMYTNLYADYPDMPWKHCAIERAEKKRVTSSKDAPLTHKAAEEEEGAGAGTPSKEKRARA